jgi:hypothetical protein
MSLSTSGSAALAAALTSVSETMSSTARRSASAKRMAR